MKKLNIFIAGIFLFSILMSLSLVMGANEISVTTLPTSGSNHTLSQTIAVNCSSSGTGHMSYIRNATFYYNLSGTDTQIGVITNTSGTVNGSINGTLSLAGLTAGLNYRISCRLMNGTQNSPPSLNATYVDIYTSSPTCAFSIDRENVEYMNPFGVVTTQSSTKDALSTITYAWKLYNENVVVHQSSTSSAPTFSGEDFNEIGTFTLGLAVTDHWGNVAVCSNKTIFVKGKDGEVATGTIATKTITSAGGNKNIVWIVSGFVLFLLIAVVAIFFVLQKAKKR